MSKRKMVGVKNVILGKSKPKVFDNQRVGVKFDRINKHIEIIGYQNCKWDDFTLQNQRESAISHLIEDFKIIIKKINMKKIQLKMKDNLIGIQFRQAVIYRKNSAGQWKRKEIINNSELRMQTIQDKIFISQSKESSSGSGKQQIICQQNRV